MSFRPHEVDDMLAALWGPFRRALTLWESDFVASVQAQWSRSRSLSSRQERKLAEVWEGFASGRRRAGDEPEE